jgi:hypothetical protein
VTDELARLRAIEAAARAYLETSLLLLYGDIPLTDAERRMLRELLREQVSALRAALEADDPRTD